jgi:hypothetical protein
MLAKPMLKEGLFVVLGSYTTYFNFLDDTHSMYGMLYKSPRTGAEKIIGQVSVEHQMHKPEAVDQIKLLDTLVEKELTDILSSAAYAGDDNHDYRNNPGMFLVTACMAGVLALNAYVEFLEPEIIEQKEPVVRSIDQIKHTAKDKKRKDKYRKPMTKLRSVYYVQTIKDLCEKRRFERHTLCWGVRGHFRHYKSGRVVFIKPFEKGKLRGQKEQRVKKDYVIDSNQDII